MIRRIWRIPIRARPKGSLKYKFILTLAVFTVLLSVSFGFISVQRLNAELENRLLQQGQYVANNLILKYWPPEDKQEEENASSKEDAPPPEESASPTPTDLSKALAKQLTYGVVSALLASGGGDILFLQVVKDGKPRERWPNLPEAWQEELGINQILPPPVRPGWTRGVLPNGVPYFDLIAVPSGPHPPDPPNYVRLLLSLASVRSQVRQEFFIISGLSALYILVGLILAFWLYQSILGPVEVLIDSVKRFRRDRHARALVTSGDELQALAEEFNRMADTIQERDERLERINEQLRRANRVKSEFLAVMGHELKTPLHAIRGYAQLLLEGIDGPITPEQREDLENILTSSDHLRALIDNVLQFSKLEAGEEEIHPTAVELSDLVENALQNVKVLAREKGISVEIECNSLTVWADETKLKQILINLLSNALKYTTEGCIRVTAEPRGEEVLFAVRDTGIGIPPEDLDRIFEPFTQLDSSDTRAWGGIGLGLSIVKKYVEMHGGRIWVESEPGRGSSFYFTLPARPASLPPVNSPPPPKVVNGNAHPDRRRRPEIPSAAPKVPGS